MSANKGSITIMDRYEVTHYVFVDLYEYIGIKDLTNNSDVVLCKDEAQELSEFITKLFGKK